MTAHRETELNAAEPAFGRNGPVPLDPKLLDILVCPVTRTRLRYDSEAGELISDAAGLAFEVRDGIPIMLPDEARRIAVT